jgi:hypothetical protein
MNIEYMFAIIIGYFSRLSKEKYILTILPEGKR